MRIFGESPRWGVRVFALVACVLMGISAYCFRWDPFETLLLYGVDFMLAGGLFLLTALYLNRSYDTIRPDNFTYELAQAKRFISTSPNMWLILPGLLALLILIGINMRAFQLAIWEQVTLGVQLILFVVAIVFIALGLGGFRFRQRAVSAGDTPSEPTARWHWIMLGLIIVLAFVVRAWDLGGAVHKFIDEINFAVGVMSILRAPSNYRLFEPFSPITSFPWMFPFIQSWFVDLGGRNLESLRWFTVILGTLGVPALYFLAKTLFDRKTALIAALLLATFPPHIQFSRIALNNIADPLFGTLTIAFLARGLKEGRRIDFTLAGTMLGLTQYFYEGGRFLFPLLVLLWLVWHLLITRQRRQKPLLQPSDSITPPQTARPTRFFRNPRYTSLGTFFLAAALIGAPLYLTLASLNHPFDERFSTVGLGGSYWYTVVKFGTVQTPEQQLLRPILIYVNLPETGLYYGDKQGLMLPYVVMFFLLGLFWLLWHWRSLSIVLIPWLVLTSLGNMLLTDGAISARYVVTFPALMLITAVGIRYVLPLVWASAVRVSTANTARWRQIIQPLVVLALFFAIAQAAYFFGPHLETYNRQIRPAYDSEDAIFRAADLPGETLVHVISDYSLTQPYLSGTLGYLADQKTVTVLPTGGISLAYLQGLPRNVNLAFFIQPDDGITLSYLQQIFRLKGPFSSPYNIDPTKQLLLYYVPDIFH